MEVNTTIIVLLVICLIAACAFEFINGFHDTANAVATVIYTKSMKPVTAVVWSGIWNFIGVYVGGIGVAMGIVSLLSNTVLVDQNVFHSVAMILALVLTAIIWNLGTWYVGLPCSSSHTLIGSIFGVGIAYMLLPDAGAVALNWVKVKDVGLSLLISPVIGFGLAIALMALFKRMLSKRSLFFHPTPKKKRPPIVIRATIIATSTLLSFFHGSNDGQKGVGLVMIILIALLPAKFALDHSKTPLDLNKNIVAIQQVVDKVNMDSIAHYDQVKIVALKTKLSHVTKTLGEAKTFNETQGNTNLNVRKDIASINKDIASILEPSDYTSTIKLSKEDRKTLKHSASSMKSFIEFVPWWVILMISVSLGLGTMIGWKRIVVTVGEKIGKTQLSYAQGTTANLVTATTIGLSTAFGLPASTTHVLSSGVAGSMVASNGVKNLRMGTVKSILIAWLVTLPVTMIMSALLFLLFRAFL